VNIPANKYYADSMAFIGLQGQPPTFDLSCRPRLSLAHLTSVPPFLKKYEDALNMHNSFRNIALRNLGVHEIRTSADVSGNPGSMGLLFGLQHAPEKLTVLRVRQLSELGVRSMAIAYDEPNEYGSGFKNPKGELTKCGENLIRWLGRYGIILDLSHAGHETAVNAMSLILRERLPTKVMASHSGCFSIFRHPRNLMNQSIRAIRVLDGYIGIPLITFLISKEKQAVAGRTDPYLAAFYDHHESWTRRVRQRHHDWHRFGLQPFQHDDGCGRQTLRQHEENARNERYLRRILP